MFSAAIFSNLSFYLEILGNLTWMEARRPVPTFVGHVVKYPRWELKLNLATASIAFCPFANLPNTYLMSPPGCIEMILNWSSSLTQHKKVLASLWKIPRESGHYLLSPHVSKNLSPSLNKKWSAISYFLLASDNPPKG